jgi:peptidoglycan/xylan/chitin deacetylase (PgdA/CDA1 family)
MYHSVGGDGVFRDNVVPERLFEEHLAWLTRRRRIVPMRALLERLETGGSPPDDWTVLTFDDGYLDNRRIVLPLLRKHGVPASFFPALGVVEEGKRFFYDDIQALLDAAEGEAEVELDGRPARLRLEGRESRDDAAIRLVLAVRGRSGADRDGFVDALRRRLGAPEEAARPLYLGPEDVRALAAAGMEVGSHTLTHPNLAALRNGELEEEISGSKTRLERLADAPVRGFAYPFGKRSHVSEEAARTVRLAGYRYALTTEFGRASRGCDVFALPRIGVRGPLVRLKVNLLGVPL